MVTKEIIDKIFELENYEDILRLVGEKETVENSEEVWIQIEEIEKEKEKNYQKFIKEVRENNLYEYFLEQGSITDNIATFADLHRFSKMLPVKFVEDIKNKNLELNMKSGLIKATGNSEYIKECIKDELWGLGLYQKVELIKATNDLEYIKECIKDKSLGLALYQKVELIKATNDFEYIKECIEDKTMKLDGYDIYELIKATNNSEYIKKCINNDLLELGIYQKFELIKATNDSEYIKTCIKDETLNLLQYQKVELIKEINEPQYIKECIKDKKLGLETTEIYDLIRLVNDSKYTKECIENKKIKFDSNQIFYLVKEINDPVYMKKIIGNKSVKLDKDKKIELIKLINDTEYTKKCIINNDLSFNKKEKLVLSLATKDKQLIKENVNIFYKPDEKDIKLPKGITIGTEIETEGTVAIRGKIFDGWKGEDDSTVDYCTELISPILTGKKKDVENIYTMCNVLKTLDAKATQSCGGHIHIGADYLTSKKSFENLIEIYTNVEEILYIISNKEGELTRINGINAYAFPLSGKLEKALQKGSITLKDDDELNEFVEQLKNVQGSRCTGINLRNAIKKQTKKTIEFRLPNGTINPDTWIENINLFGGIIASAEKLKNIQEKSDDERTKEENEYINVLEMLKSKEISQEEKLKLLLKLSIEEPEDRKIYENRYKVNNKLLNERPDIQKALKEQIAVNSINLSSKDKKEDFNESLINTYKNAQVSYSKISEINKYVEEIRDQGIHTQEK